MHPNRRHSSYDNQRYPRGGGPRPPHWGGGGPPHRGGYRPPYGGGGRDNWHGYGGRGGGRGGGGYRPWNDRGSRDNFDDRGRRDSSDDWRGGGSQDSPRTYPYDRTDSREGWRHQDVRSTDSPSQGYRPSLDALGSGATGANAAPLGAGAGPGSDAAAGSNVAADARDDPMSGVDAGVEPMAISPVHGANDAPAASATDPPPPPPPPLTPAAGGNPNTALQSASSGSGLRTVSAPMAMMPPATPMGAAPAMMSSMSASQLPGQQGPMPGQQGGYGMGGFNTPFRSGGGGKPRPGFGAQQSYPGGAPMTPHMYNSGMGPRGPPMTPGMGPGRMPMGTPGQHAAMAQRQRVEAMVAADKRLLEHVAPIWAVEDTSRDRDRRLAEDARKLRDAESRARIDAVRAVDSVEFTGLKVAVCNSRLAAIRQQIEALN